MNSKLSLCPVCIYKFKGEWGTEPHDFAMNHVQFQTCAEHHFNKDMTIYASAGIKLSLAHNSCDCKKNK